MGRGEEHLIRPLESGVILRARYKIVKMVGQGGMGAIYLAEDMRLEGRQCAIKETAPDPDDVQPTVLSQTQEQFYREASVLARLDHPTLPKVSDYFAEDGRDYLVMDYIAGRDLRELVDEARRQERFLDEQAILSWMDQLCDALEYLHSQTPPVVHRDIKPANVKLTSAGTIKLVDFGLVKLLASDDLQTVTVIQGRGTVQYTPLEQYGGDAGHTDIRSDIYSLGATLYHLGTGQPPVEAKQRFLRPESLITPREINPSLSVQTERTILRAMAMHPDARFENTAQVRASLFEGTPLAHSNRRQSRFVGPASWPAAIQANAFWIILALLVLGIATLVTLHPPLVAMP
jgi:eukaryotic-like serine/threonine-protein kinase